MTARSTEFETMIVGGGMVGASLAIALASIGQRVAVIEAHPPGDPGQPSFDDRATALSNGSRRVFAALAVWPELADRATPIKEIHVSDRGRFGITRIKASEEGVPALGFMVRNRHIGHALMMRVQADPNITLLSPARVGAVLPGPGRVELELQGEAALASRIGGGLLVAADGARSSMRELLGIAADVRDYQQLAIVANIATEKDLSGVAYERFTETGPLAVLPMSDEDAPGAGGRATIVWSVSPDTGRELQDLPEQVFRARLQAQLGYRLGAVTRTGLRSSYPLALVQSEEQVRDRIVIIGNAAHSLHPVAGQGFNLSLRDVAALAETIADAASRGEDPGSLAVLQRYADWRVRDQRDVVRFSDGLLKIFSSPSPLLRTGRNLGLLALELVPGAKHLLARQTMGVAGRLPKLARGVALK